MEGRHGQKKEEATQEALKIKAEKEAVFLSEYLALKASFEAAQKENKRDTDALKITTAMLRKSPDYYSVWNFRRTILLEGFLKDANVEAADTIYNNELAFVQDNLKLNPKSYWMWNHRRWCLEHMAKPDWQRELAMVKKFLDLDARNFHGWDYRRYIIRQLNQADNAGGALESVRARNKSEFDFTTDKISQNFSNYSAWHNRSTLLEKLALEMSPEERQETIDIEFDLVKNAIYTDPEDQSAWLYELWLIGREPKQISVLGSSVISFKPLEIVVAFDEVVRLHNPFVVSTREGSNLLPLEGEWRATGNDPKLGSVWIFQQAEGTEYGAKVEVAIYADDVISQRFGPRLAGATLFELDTTDQTLEEANPRKLAQIHTGLDLMCDLSKRVGSIAGHDGKVLVDPKKEYRVTSLTVSPTPAARVELLEREISAVEELLEIEPNSKWPMQVLSVLLSELRKTHALHSTQAKELDDRCIDLQEKLIHIDELRQERYEDRRTQLVFERETLGLVTDARHIPLIEYVDHAPATLDLSMRGLTHIPMSSYFVHLRDLNLESNSISTTKFLRNLLTVRTLNLSKNSIKRLEGVQHAPSLEYLNLEGNLIESWEDVVSGFVFWQEGKMGRLGGSVQVVMVRNPVIENEGGVYVLDQRWKDCGQAGVAIQWKATDNGDLSD